MKNNDFAVNMNQGGELVQEHLQDLHNVIRDKYKADSPFLWASISYFLMIACVVIDVAVFRSLFVKISYDNPAMIWLQVAGLAFAADVVAAYAGILAKRIRQGLSRDKLNLVLLLLVPIFALIINGVLRYMTMPLLSVDGTVDAAVIAETIFAIVTPIFTSIGNFAISFQTYDPLGQKMCREEIALVDIRDYCRRLEAIKEECNDFSEEQIKEMDRQHLANAKKELVNDALILYAYARTKLMEHLGDPASTNMLSKSRCDEVFERLTRELKALESVCSEDISHERMDGIKEKHIISFSEAA